MQIIKNFLWRLLDAIPNMLALLVVGALLIAYYREGLNLAGLLEILNVIIWPLIVLIALLFFRRVLTFLFFSLDEFNFFGAKGKLKNVKDMIREKADELWQKERQEQEREAERSKNLKELETLKGSNEAVTGQATRVFTFAERLIEEKAQLQTQISTMQAQIDALLAQITMLQGKSSEAASSVVSAIVGQAEEARDVGTISPSSASSEASDASSK
ncbi:hypothetical protein A2765_05970 [Candidatus Kaiserbacteria bacterium RIFCSPHIGHO2_01_FULL_56_24]|uniref:Uncharacterized protein n=1 Tax=Candidatus Kaiserbacteria bacterium RIFCSPHIGHO2_01_FULL_56_24 TaxID=1798487 RepID=A0A1F6D8L2_9BACT|nr:MAG: hypothetical protein A2765_05970 [Candidatus Kaiserbacteria bacterium RIFCSPHIGHO2_01_FULL_56_24]